MDAFAKEIPDTLEELFLRSDTGRAPGWRLQRRTKCYIRVDGVEAQELTPAALEKIPGYALLRGICENGDIDVAVNIRILPGRTETAITVALDLQSPFSAGRLVIGGDPKKGRAFDIQTGNEILPPPPPPPPLPELPPLATPTENPITVSRPLQLKK